MNRCTPLSFLQRSALPALLTVGLSLVATAGLAQGVRQFPPNALRGTMQITQPPELLMDGRLLRLSPGARIKNPDNMLVLSGSLVGQSLVVNYVRDGQGMVRDVWLITNAEAAQPMATAAPASNIVSQFDKPADANDSKSSTDLNSNTQP